MITLMILMHCGKAKAGAGGEYEAEVQRTAKQKGNKGNVENWFIDIVGFVGNSPICISIFYAVSFATPKNNNLFCFMVILHSADTLYGPMSSKTPLGLSIESVRICVQKYLLSDHIIVTTMLYSGGMGVLISFFSGLLVG